MRMEILNEVSSLERVMKMLYSRFITMHMLVVHLNDWQQNCARRACILSDLHTIVYHMKTWNMRYKGAPSHLPKMMKPRVVELKACIPIQVWNYGELPQFITSLQASHERLIRTMDVIMRMYVIPFICKLTEAKAKN